jgi:predicted DNA-binding transcriptional regulator YafY
MRRADRLFQALGAWCELRGDFRTFRVDRVERMDADGTHPDVEGRRLADFVRCLQKWV